MKRGKRVVYALFAVLLLTLSTLSTSDVEAGISTTSLGASTLGTSEWNNPEGDVKVENDVLIFPEDSTEYTRFIAKTAAKQDKDFSVLLNASGIFNLKKLPAGKTFSFAFGLPGIESLPGEAGSVEVVFSNQGGIKIGIVAYDEDGNKVTVSEAKPCSMTINKAATVAVSISSDWVIKVQVNGKQLASGKLPVSGEGRIGFLQTGECAVTISDLKITHYKYERPENTNISEDFEQGAMDTSKLTARTIADMGIFPAGQVVEEYNGNQVLMFRNTQNAYFGTLHKYSNFELTFDVPYIQTQTKFSEDGILEAGATDKIIVAFGLEEADFTAWSGWKKAGESISCGKYFLQSNNYDDESAAWKNHNPYQDGGRAFSIKVKVVDGVVTAGIKWMEERSFEELLHYTLPSGMPTGYISIWAEGPANFAIDNLKITNLDTNPALIEVEYKNGKIEKPEDVEYIPMERVYAPQKQEEKVGFSMWYCMPIGVAVVGIVALTIVALKGRKHRKMKGGEVE